MKIKSLLTLAIGVSLVLANSWVSAGNSSKSSADESETVDMFTAMENDQVEVQFIPKNATQANVLIKNKTDKPLTIKLPEAFAGVPVLAQFGGGGLGGGGLGGGGLGGGGGQGVGGGLGGGGGGQFGGGGGGGGLFNVAPGKVGKVKAQTVCLEHGKPDPNPRMKYKIVKIESFTDNAEVAELCKLLGHNKLPQNTAQAAAWHMMDGLTWEQLANKDRIRLRNGYTQKYFSSQELRLAIEVVREVSELAKAKGVKSPGESVSPGEVAADVASR